MPYNVGAFACNASLKIKMQIERDFRKVILLSNITLTLSKNLTK